MVKYTVLHILYGEDDFSSHEALQKIKAEIGGGDLAGGSTTVLDGKTVTLDQIAVTCDAMPFFTAQRLVIIEGLLQKASPWRSRNHDRTSKKAPESEFASLMEGYVRRMPPCTVLVLLEGGIRGANPLLKRLAPLAKVQTFPRLRGERLHNWIQDRVTAKGGRISHAAARLVGETAGDNLWSLSNELDKLLLYSGGPAISEEDVRNAMSQNREANKFAMMDALLARQADQAERMLHRLLDEGMKAPQIVDFCARELGLLLRARETLESKTRREDIPSRLGLAPGFRMDKILRQARESGMPELKRLYEMLLSLDLDVKTGAMNEELALDLFVADVCLRA